MKKRKIKKQFQNLAKKEVKEINEKGAVISDNKKLDAGMMKIDLHCHSEASWDCMTALESFPARLIEQGIKIQAITDHNEIWGAKKLQQIVRDRNIDITIIVGEEILTDEGEIIGLFLKEKIEKGLSPEDTIQQIKDQGGISILPHGFDPLKRYRLSDEARERVWKDIDLIETFNTRVSRQKWNKKAAEYANDKNKLMSSGSDAHTLKDVGTAWIEVQETEINSPQDLLAAIEGGLPTGTWVNPIRSLTYRAWDMARNVVFGFRKSTGEI